MTNYAVPDANGRSIAFNPIAFTEQGSRDTLVVEAGQHEGVYLACFDLDAIREYRGASRGAMPSGSRIVMACWSSSM